MSTKRISRSIKEGGKAGASKIERRIAYGAERARTRDFLNKVLLNPELADEEIIDNYSKDIDWECSSYNISPMYRWLESQVGKPWSEVRSEISKKFDSKIKNVWYSPGTIDHVLSQVVDTESGFNDRGKIAEGYEEYFVDENDILQKSYDRHSWRHKYKWQKIPDQTYIDVANWLNGRMIVENSGEYHWVAPTEGVWSCSWIHPYNERDKYKLTYYLFDKGEYIFHEKYYIQNYLNPQLPGYYNWRRVKKHGEHWEEIENPFSFKVRGELTNDELSYFHSLPDRIKNDILSIRSNK